MKPIGIKKLYYSISEVSRIAELEQYVLRYWESEFGQLNPSKNRAGNRIYTHRDIQLILKIKELLRDKRYTIEGAKNVLSTLQKDDLEGEQFTLPIGDVEKNISGEDIPAEIKNEILQNDLKEVKELLEILLKRLQ
ncbi:MAG: MerR family transcriptional regulator [Bacteroidota bacterium]